MSLYSFSIIYILLLNSFIVVSAVFGIGASFLYKAIVRSIPKSDETTHNEFKNFSSNEFKNFSSVFLDFD